MIILKSISKQYKSDQFCLNNIDLHIKAGEFVSLTGESGTGKTTLVKLIIAEEKTSKGNIEIGGWDITNISNKDIPFLRRQIGVIFQDFKLIDKKTVEENIAFALEVAGDKKKRINKIVPKVLDVVGLSHKKYSYPHELSGGEQQRVAIARSLVHAPKILVADEPTGNLDTLNTEDIMEILKKINDFGTTVLLVTHNRDIVNRLKKRVVTIHNGKIISDEESGKYRL